MPSPPIPGSDIPVPITVNTGAVRAQADDRSFETDFAALAARFVSRSGGGLSPELAADLALEIVLHEIAEQACVATDATGAAIVLHRDGELTCRARYGKNAPELGARLAADGGLSAECIRTGLMQRCDDVEADPRADAEASRQLGVLSLLVLPLLNGDKLAGVFELFSSRTFAFGEREERALEGLADRTLQSLQLAAEPLALPSEEVADVEMQTPETQMTADALHVDGPVDFPPRRFDRNTWIWAAAVVACSVLLAVVVVAPSEWRKAAARPAASSTSANPAETGVAGNPVAPSDHAMANSPTSQSLSNESGSNETRSNETNDTDSIPAGSLSVYADGKEVFHLTPARAQAQADEAEQGTAIPRAVAHEPENIIELLPASDPAVVLKRVEPVYPKEARRQHIQGPVVLDVRIGSSGEVQKVQLVSGAAPLARASVEAVRRWTFKPRTVDGRAVEMQTRVTLKFRLQD